MRKYGLLLVIPLLLVWSAENSAQPQWYVLSPTTYALKTGAPIVETLEFSAFGGSATIKLTGGNPEYTTVKGLNSSTVTLNGQVVFSPSDFKGYANHLERDISLHQGKNTLKLFLKEDPGTQVTIKVVQEVPAITPDIVRVRTANALRVGNIRYAFEGFQPDSKRFEVIGGLDAKLRNRLALHIEKAELTRETENMRFYQYKWTDESGENFIKFTMARDDEGKWIITSW